MLHLIKISNESDSAYAFLEVVFALTRSHFTAIYALSPKEPEGPLSKSLLPCKAVLPGMGQLLIEFETPVGPKDMIILAVEFDSDEPPRMKSGSPTWGTLDDDRRRDLGPDRVFIAMADLDFSTLFGGFDFYAATRKWDTFLITEPDPTIRRYKAFFHALDLVTNLDLQSFVAIDEEDKKKAVMYAPEAFRALGNHRLTRLQSIIVGRPTNLDDLPREVAPELTTYYSDLMLPVYRHFFSGEDGELNQDDLAEAFCRFANGEFRTGDSLDENSWNCEPDSSNHLHFANHALWSILSGVREANEWEIILRCSAASQEFYMRAYHPDREPPYLLVWYAPWNYKNTPRLTRRQITQVFSRYARWNLKQLSAQLDVNLQRMLLGKFQRQGPEALEPV